MEKQRIIDLINSNYDIGITSLSFLPGGADMNASVYKAQGKESYFVKLKQGYHDFSVMELLSGIEQVIAPLKIIHGEDFTLVVYPFIQGVDGFNCNLTPTQWRKLGKGLRQIHEIEVQKEIRKEDFSPKWREAVRSLYPHMEAVPFMQKRMVQIRRLVDRAEQLSLKIKNQSLKFVLCHSDIHGGNVLLVGTETIFIVDWDDPIMAPKERDLMFIGGGVGNVWNKPEEEAFFYEGYGNTEVNMTILTYYRHERIVEDIAIYTQEILFGKDKQTAHMHYESLFEPNGVVDIAFANKSFI